MPINKNKPNEKIDTRQKSSISALFCPYHKYIWTLTRVMENEIVLNHKAFQVENVMHLSDNSHLEAQKF